MENLYQDIKRIEFAKEHVSHMYRNARVVPSAVDFKSMSLCEEILKDELDRLEAELVRLNAELMQAECVGAGRAVKGTP